MSWQVFPNTFPQQYFYNNDKQKRPHNVYGVLEDLEKAFIGYLSDSLEKIENVNK